MKRVFLIVALVSLAVLARADEQTQAVQQVLKDKGFYYGEVDGQGGPETDAAIRRYQIREGLEVTGKLDAQTLTSLNLGGGSTNGNTQEAAPPASGDSAEAHPAAPARHETQPPQGTAQNDQDFLRRQPQPEAPAPDQGEAVPQPPQPPQPPEPPDQADAGQSMPVEYVKFFRKTPYETAPPVVQRSTVQRAKERLARAGFYRGVVDGELGDSLSRALVAYQRDGDLPPTGRLDMETLSDMNLLPKPHVVIRPPVPYEPFYGDPADGREVYRGIWVR